MPFPSRGRPAPLWRVRAAVVTEPVRQGCAAPRGRPPSSFLPRLDHLGIPGAGQLMNVVVL
ncbi:hypothetical protein ACWDE9_44260, partial [Streptomyces olivaceoviridis]